jgi:hypothetical protein
LILLVFYHFGAFNRAGKTVSKIGIYALPPLKSEIYRFLMKLGREFIHLYLFFKIFIMPLGFKNVYHAIELFTSVLLVLELFWLMCSFSVLLLDSSSAVWVVGFFLYVELSIQNRECPSAPKKGHLRRSSRQFITT